MTVPIVGETCNGDAVYTRLDPSGKSALVAVIDGLGHGKNAAYVADQAVSYLSAEQARCSVSELIHRLDTKLRGGRGAAATLCMLDGYQLSACGVGNVALRSRGTVVPFVLSPGVLGVRVHTVRATSVTLKPNDRIVLHSDGLSSTFSLDMVAHLDTEAACRALFEAQRKRSDDATVVVIDVRQ